MAKGTGSGKSIGGLLFGLFFFAGRIGSGLFLRIKTAGTDGAGHGLATCPGADE